MLTPCMLILPPLPSETLLLPLAPAGFVKHGGLWVPQSVSTIEAQRQFMRLSLIDRMACEITCRLPADLCVERLAWSLAEAEVDFNERLAEIAARNRMRVLR